MKRKIIETSSVVLPDGGMLEQIRDYDFSEVYFAYYDGREIRKIKEKEANSKLYRPIDNAIVASNTVLFPSYAEPYGSIEGLRQEVQDFIHRYVDITNYYESLSSYYVLLSWVFERFSVLPYLRVIGEPGTGKSRFLHTVSAICYKPIRTSGAVSVASIFRMIEQFHGTLILEEADLPSKSDEYASVVKILNSGHEKGNPVLRQEATKKGYETVAYDTFGPKIIATRKRFDDVALETRTLTEKMTKMTRRERIPLNLPVDFNQQAMSLRNKLLMFRLTNFHKIEPSTIYAMDGIEPRILHIISPFLDMMPEDERGNLLDWARTYTQDLITERGSSIDGDVVRALFDIIDDCEDPSVKNITEKLNVQYEREADKLSSRRVGKILKDLGLIKKRHGRGFVIDVQASSKTLELLERQYGIERE